MIVKENLQFWHLKLSEYDIFHPYIIPAEDLKIADNSDLDVLHSMISRGSIDIKKALRYAQDDSASEGEGEEKGSDESEDDYGSDSDELATYSDEDVRRIKQQLDTMSKEVEELKRQYKEGR